MSSKTTKDVDSTVDNNNSTNSNVLYGFIYFSYPDLENKLQAENVSQTETNNWKRKWFEEGQPPLDLSWFGYYFATDKHEENPPWTRDLLHIPLIVPLNMLPEISHVALEKRKVRIRRYGIVRQILPQQTKSQHFSKKQATADSSDNKIAINCNTTQDIIFIELLTNGIDNGDNKSSLLEDKTDAFKSSSILPQPSVLSLHEFQNLEQSKNSQKAKLSQCRFHISAIVDAISPILPVKGDPFALIELYQHQNENQASGDVLTCIAVMKGAALLHHSCIQPGQRLVLRNIRRQKWHVPQSFLKKNIVYLQNRAPTHVFVTSDPRQIEVEDCYPLYDTIRLTTKNHELYTIQGAIIDIVYLDHSSSLFYLLDVGDQKNQSLFLQHFPTPKSISFGLRVGAVIRASNVHSIILWNNRIEGYAACIRSSISILKCATAANNTDESTIFHQVVTDAQPHVEKGFKFSLLGGVFSPHEAVWKNKIMGCIGTTMQTLLKKLSSGATEKKYCHQTLINLLLEFSEEEKNSECLRGNIPNQKLLDPYAEFFCHTFDINKESKSGVNCIVHCAKRILPAVVSLSNVHKICSSHMIQKICHLSKHKFKEGLCTTNHSHRLSNNKVRFETGLTFADHLSAEWLLDQLNITNQSDNKPKPDLICVGFADISDDGKVVAIQDDNFRIPLIGVSSCNPLKCCRLSNQSKISNGDLIGIKIRSSIVSGICIGPAVSSLGPATATSAEAESTSLLDGMFNLPVSAQIDENLNEFFKGACSVITIGGYVFLLATHIKVIGDIFYVSLALPSDRKTRSANVDTIIPTRSPVLSLMDLLEHKAPSSFSPSPRLPSEAKANPIVLAVLVRQRLKLVKIQNQKFSGFSCTLGHIPASKLNSHEQLHTAYSPIQSIEVKVDIQVTNRCIDVMRSAMQSQLTSGTHRSPSMSESQLGAATAWWSLADRSSLCTLLSGGWDERECLSEELYDRVVVELPICRGNNLREWKANANDMKCYYTGETPSSKVAMLKDRFHVIGGTKVFPGCLDRCPNRVIWHRPGGELIAAPNEHCGVPVTSIAQLFYMVCEEIRGISLINSALSIVRNIQNARLASLSYCRAKVQCTRCFKFLDDKGSRCGLGNNTDFGVERSVQKNSRTATKQQVSFWHKPLPISGQSANISDISSVPKVIIEKFEEPVCSKNTLVGRNIMNADEPCNFAHVDWTTPLCCPNGCPLSQASVFWECSGVIDDGSGQAKLYAEREAAKLLLGKSLDVSMVEEGAWYSKEGVWFNYAVPPSPEIRAAVREALLMKDQLVREDRSRRFSESDVLQLMTPVDRAQYTLYKHCRESNEPLRRMQFLCRCKSFLPDSASPLGRSKIEVMSNEHIGFGGRPLLNEVATFTLPTLKLKLIDCCMPIPEEEMAWELKN